MQSGLMLQMLLRDVGNKTEIGLSNKQTLFNFDKPMNAFLLKETIWFDSKFSSSKSIKPLKISSIWLILLFCSHNTRRVCKLLNVKGSIVLIYFELRSILLEFQGLQLHTEAKFSLFKWIYEIAVEAVVKVEVRVEVEVGLDVEPKKHKQNKGEIAFYLTKISYI